MKNIKKIRTVIFTTIMFLFVSNFVYAQESKTNKPVIDDLLYTFTTTGTSDATTTDYIASLPSATPGLVIGQITYYILVIANILAFISFLASGIFMIISQGNEDQLGNAKKMLMYTIIAMIVCAAALAIVTGITRLQFFNP